MIWKNLLGWALKAATSSQVKTAGLQAAQQAIGQLNSVIDEHIPDGAQTLKPMVDTLAAVATGFINSKQG